jgi:hypothetical protein
MTTRIRLIEAGQPRLAQAVHSSRQHHPDAPAQMDRFSFGAWLKEAASRLHRNKLATALANKLSIGDPGKQSERT